MSRQMKDSGIEWIGVIPEDWKVERIKYCYHTISGATPKSGVEEYWDGDITWITPADYKTDDIIVSKSRKQITRAGLNSCGTTLVPKNSIIVSNRAPIGAVALAGVDLCTNQGCKSLVNKNDLVLNRFIYYYLTTMTTQLNMIGRGTTFLELSTYDLSNFYITMPKLNLQEQISNFLDQKVSEIDHILEKTKESIEEYKKYKQSIITEAVTKGLNPNVEMKDSGIEWIGEIPKHWNPTKLKYMARKIIDGTHSTPTYTSEGVPFLRVTDISSLRSIDDEVKFEKTARISKDEHEELIKRCYPEKGDLLVSKNGTIGIPKVISWDEPFSIFVSLCLIKLNNKIDVGYLYYYFKSTLIWTEISIGGKTGTITNLHLDKIKEFTVPIGSIEEQKEIVLYLNEKNAEIDNLISQKETLLKDLELYKKSLIYECVTGKREVM